jgi:hypothetical protein
MYLIQSHSIRRGARQAILRAFGIDAITIEFNQASGLPIVNYGTRRGVFIGRQLNPVHIALYACRELRLEDTTGPIHLPQLPSATGSDYVRRAVKWLVSNEKRLGHIHIWECNFPWPDYNLKPPWRCALAEAFGALVLLRTGALFQARRHLEAILTDYRHDGVSYVEKGVFFPLEYVSDERILVLNGILHCLLVLDECGTILDDPALKSAFCDGYRSIKPRLQNFDAGYCTSYDSLGRPADEKYHRIHVELLRRVYKRTGDRDLLTVIARWTRYSKSYAVAEPIALLHHIVKSRGRL